MTLADLEEAKRLAEHHPPPDAYEFALRHYQRTHPGAPAAEAEAFAGGVRWLAEERIQGIYPVSAWVLRVLILAEGRTP
jgi:hypothetical protein